MPVELVHLDGSVLPPISAIVDSGADCTTLPEEWAKKIGIDLQKDCVKEICATAGGPMTNHVYPDGIDGIVLGEKIRLNAQFNPGLGFALLGRRDFFDWYRILFDQRAKTFTIEPYSDRPGD